MDNKKTDNIISIFAILIILGILAYIFYNILKSNTLFNSNELMNNISENISDPIELSKEVTPIEKEIVYTETEIASFTTTLYDNDENRIFNITKACEILNNTEIKTGEEFSFNSTIGPMGTGNGYKLAKGFDSNGKLIDVPAGGMCQVSSTLYNVALIANLEITERHAHSRRVAYVPVDKDATIYYPDLDLKFINNTQNDLRITAQNDNYTVTIKLYKKEQSN
ncbi:MAG: VanW family protein [Clostridia bacterium]|nr:VanW family protein [Clostridia bacterium]